MYADRHISVIVPAHNEAPSIGRVLESLFALIEATDGSPLIDQVVVCDNGSTDDTARIASRFPCAVVAEPELGYGAACQAALNYPSEKDIVVFVDADCSVDVSELPLLLERIKNGADLIIGSRVPEYRQSGALSVPQLFGNRLASFLIRLFWHQSVTDLGPFRAVTWKGLQAINMQDRRYGWTVEMQVRAVQEGLQMEEIPVSTLKRIGHSKISGTISGVLGAGAGILGTLFKLLIRERLHVLKRRAGIRESAL